MIKGKRIGRLFESRVRRYLQKEGWFIYVKGISTPGPDILGLNNCNVLLLELKSFEKRPTNIYKLMKSLYEKLCFYSDELKRKGVKNVHVGVLLFARNEKLYYYFHNNQLFTFSTLKGWYEWIKEKI